MEVKIRQGNEMLDATIEMVDGVMVVSPKEEKFEPKDGDVVVYMNTGMPTIYIYRAGTSKNTSYYAAYSSKYYATFISSSTDHLRGNQNIRPATEEEKKKLFDKLKEEGYEWDAEKKELRKKRWKPGYNSECYFKPRLDMGQFIAHETRWLNDVTDNAYNKKGWIFKTERECESFCDKLNEAINSVQP